MSQRERKRCQFLWTWHCWTKCFVPHISSQRRPIIFKGPKNHSHFTFNFRPCKIWPISLTRNVGKKAPRDAVSSSKGIDALWKQLEDLKNTTCKETIKLTFVYFIIVVASPTIITAFIIYKKSKYMQYGVKEEMTTGAFPPPYTFVVCYSTKAISRIVPWVYVT